jgi:hypothetical protein
MPKIKTTIAAGINPLTLNINPNVRRLGGVNLEPISRVRTAQPQLPATCLRQHHHPLTCGQCIGMEIWQHGMYVQKAI